MSNEVFGIPRYLGFVGPVAGLSVLDAGCGEGRSARHLARLGARVTAVDISSGMLDHARHEEAREPLGIRYEQASFVDLRIFAGGAFDAVISIMALMDTPDLDNSLLEFARVLRPGGRLAFMILHPCFITPGSGKASDLSGRRALLQVGRYFDEAPFVEHWSFPGGEAHRSEFAVPRLSRTLARYVNGVVGAGLHLVGLEEPRPSVEEHARHHGSASGATPPRCICSYAPSSQVTRKPHDRAASPACTTRRRRPPWRTPNPTDTEIVGGMR